jgi:hypothetical protein
MIRVLNFGGGTNSAALAIECIRRGIKIDLMPFADTGSEFPHTYEFCSEFSAWSLANGGPPVSVVRWIRVRGEQRGQFVPLHTWCIQHKTAPSRTFGLSGCTVKWKQQPRARCAGRGMRVLRWVMSLHSPEARTRPPLPFAYTNWACRSVCCSRQRATNSRRWRSMFALWRI